MSLYRKYRPQTFAHLVGQNHVNQTLSNAIKLDKVNHAYLFTGPRGTGKTSTARLLSKAINCTDLDGAEPCDKCEICIDISDGRLIDLIEIDAASNRGIDEIRDLREKINFSPTRAKSKVYIIDEVHMLTKEAFNALLKTLEEPPTHVYFILATTEVHKIPETILSRCQRFDFKRIDESVLIDRLKYIASEEKIDTEDKALEVIAHHAEGGMRDAIGLLEQLTTDSKLSYSNVCEVLGISGFESLEKLYDYLIANDVKSAVAEIHTLYIEGNDLSYFNKRFLEYLRKKLLASIETGDSQLSARILKFVEHFQEAYGQFKYSTIAQLPLEIAIVRSCEVATAVSPAPPAPLAEERTHQKIAPVAKPQAPETKAKEPAKEPESGVPEKSDPPETNESTEVSESAEKKSLDLGTIKKMFPRIIENIKNPIAKRSLQQGMPISLNGTSLTLGFSNDFYKNKLMETVNCGEVENSISEIVGFDLKVIGEVQKVKTTVAVEPPKTDEPVSETGMGSGSSGSEHNSENDLESQVLNIFEGEFA